MHIQVTCRSKPQRAPVVQAHACGSSTRLWYKHTPVVQARACGTSTRLWYKHAPVVQAHACGTSTPAAPRACPRALLLRFASLHLQAKSIAGYGQYQPFTITSVMQNYMTYNDMLERCVM